MTSPIRGRAVPPSSRGHGAGQREVREIAGEVRDGILALSESHDPAVRRIENILTACGLGPNVTFPNQWCDFASCVLGGYLARETGDPTIDLVHAGGRDSNSEHLWLSYHGLIIDITCDQYPDAPAAPFVARRSHWHWRRFPVRTPENVFARRLKSAYFERATLALACRLSSLGSLTRVRTVRAAARHLGLR